MPTAPLPLPLLPQVIGGDPEDGYDDDDEEDLAGLLAYADHAVTFFNPYFSSPDWYGDAVREALENGVQIQVIYATPFMEMPMMQLDHEQLDLLAMDGVLVYIYPYRPLHMKWVFFDDDTVMMGSGTWDRIRVPMCCDESSSFSLQSRLPTSPLSCSPPSGNMDFVSTTLNYEANVVITSQRLVDFTTAVTGALLNNCVAINIAADDAGIIQQLARRSWNTKLDKVSWRSSL